MRPQLEDMRPRVLNALYLDLAVPRDRLNVDVENGWVTVFGTVDPPYKKACADSGATGVSGVIGVTNLIRLADTQQTKPQSKEGGQSHHLIRLYVRPCKGRTRPVLSDLLRDGEACRLPCPSGT
jgi:BON domain